MLKLGGNNRKPTTPPATTAAAGTSWDSERERSRKIQAAKSADGRDISPLPPVADPERRKRGGEDFEFFCRTYFPLVFNLPWSVDHREAIEAIETIVRDGGQLAYAMPRGSGKTSLAEAAVVWATLYGYRKFPLVIGSDQGSALELLESVKKELECNELLLADFPEVCYPIRRLDGIPHRCAGQTFEGKRTHIHWAADGIVLPSIPGSVASASIIGVAGLTGRLRGMKFKRPDGVSVRPDLVILDDPQTDESARSPSQCATRKRLVNGAVLGLAGPGKKIAALMPCTVVAQGDLSDELLDREKSPQWRGRRTAMVKSWPTNQQLWDQYADIRAADLRAGGTGQAAADFYRANREQMDAGFVVSWPARKAADEMSGQQHAMTLRLVLGDVAFFAEYQNAPLIEQQGEVLLTATEIARKRNGLKRRAVPLGRDYLTAFIDVQHNMLFYVVVAWSQDFTGDVVDYGTFPEQRLDYFTKRDARRTLKREFPRMGQMAQIYAGLEKLTEDLRTRQYIRDDGVAMPITRCPIDANWGDSTGTIYKFCRESSWGGVVIPSHGKYVSATQRPWEQYTKREGELLGHHWMLPSVKGKRAVRHLLIDTNYWKSFVHERLSINIGDPGALSLYGEKVREGRTDELHRLISEHWTAEYCKKRDGNGRSVLEWFEKPGRPDNDLFDCLVGAAAAASMLGCKALGPHKPATKRKQPKRAKVTYLN